MKLIFYLFFFFFNLIYCWIKSSNLSNWYSDWEICMFTHKTTINEPRELRDWCWNEIKGKGSKPYFGECKIGGVRFGRRCATELQPFNLKIYLQMSYSEELDNPSVKYLQRFSSLLNKLNGVLIPYGDSQMSTFQISLNCENLNRNANLTISEFTSDYQQYCNFLKPYDSINYLKNFFSNLYTKYSHIFLLINFGTHYNEKSDRIHHHLNSKVHFIENYHIIFEWLKEFSKEKNITVAWIETYPQHFPTPTGYFTPGLNISMGCSPIPQESTRDDWRNYEIRNYLHNHSITSIYYISTYEIFAPLYREHPEGDCTHYCWSPMMYQPIYKQMYQILEDDIYVKGLLSSHTKNSTLKMKNRRKYMR